jgi:hypothetical protein
MRWSAIFGDGRYILHFALGFLTATYSYFNIVLSLAFALLYITYLFSINSLKIGAIASYLSGICLYIIIYLFYTSKTL